MEPHRIIKSKRGAILIFQSSNQGVSTVPWPYYPTTYMCMLVSVQVLFSVYHFDRMVEWLTQLVTGYYKCPLIYLRYVGAQIHTQCCLESMNMALGSMLTNT